MGQIAEVPFSFKALWGRIRVLLNNDNANILFAPGRKIFEIYIIYERCSDGIEHGGKR